MCSIHYWEFGRSVGHVLDVYSSGTSDGSGLGEEEEPPGWEKLMFSVRDERGQILSASPSTLTLRTPCTRGLARTSAPVSIWLFCLVLAGPSRAWSPHLKKRKQTKHEELHFSCQLLKAGNQQQDPKRASPNTFTNKFYFNLIHYNNFQLFFIL